MLYEIVFSLKHINASACQQNLFRKSIVYPLKTKYIRIFIRKKFNRSVPDQKISGDVIIKINVPGE